MRAIHRPRKEAFIFMKICVWLAPNGRHTPQAHFIMVGAALTTPLTHARQHVLLVFPMSSCSEILS